MSKLEALLATRTPMIWVVSDEPLRVINETAQTSTRPVYRMDVVKGLLTYLPEESRWVIVLMDDPDNPELPSPCYDTMAGIMYVLEKRGVMILENAHGAIERLISFMNHISESYSDGYMADELDLFPPSFVLISHDKKVPDELRRAVVRVDYDLPNAEDLSSATAHVSRMAAIPMPDTNYLGRIVRAGLGMTEYEFRSAVASSLLDEGKINAETVNKIKLRSLEANGVLSVRVPTLTMADIGGLDRAKAILERITFIWKNPDAAKGLKIDPLRRMLLVGVPGSGKSALAEATAAGLGLELAKFGVSQMMNKYVGESEANMRKAFAQVKAMSPLCLWIDEMGRDLSGSASSSSVDGGTTDRVHGEFLQGLQELPDNVFLVCAANRIDGLPPEMLRADRFDKILFVGFPTAEEREEIFRIHLGEDALNFDLRRLAEGTRFFTGAEIKALVREVRFEISATFQRPPATEEILAFAPKMKGRVWQAHRPAVISMYQHAMDYWDWASSSQQIEAEKILAAAQNSAAVGAAPSPAERKVPALGSGNLFSRP